MTVARRLLNRLGFVRQMQGSWVSIKRADVPAKMLRTSRYYMPPRITRNSHRPSARGAEVTNRTMVGSLQN